MPEKRFLKYILAEGILLLLLGLCILILPKLTELSFGIMLSISFIVYGIYKIFSIISCKNYVKNIVMGVLSGIFILVLGILLLFVPKINLLWIIALTGVYFLLDSISLAAFTNRIDKIYSLGWCKVFSTAVVFLTGFLIVTGLPAFTFWAVSMLCGTAFLIKGMSKITLFNNNNNTL